MGGVAVYYKWKPASAARMVESCPGLISPSLVTLNVLYRCGPEDPSKKSRRESPAAHNHLLDSIWTCITCGGDAQGRWIHWSLHKTQCNVTTDITFPSRRGLLKSHQTCTLNQPRGRRRFYLALPRFEYCLQTSSCSWILLFVLAHAEWNGRAVSWFLRPC